MRDLWNNTTVNPPHFSQVNTFKLFLQALTAQQAKAEADVRVLGERKEALQQEWEMARYMYTTVCEEKQIIYLKS